MLKTKCLLLTHAVALFSVFEAEVRSVDLRATHHLATELIEREFLRQVPRLNTIRPSIP
jgi:hypothetical protein